MIGVEDEGGGGTREVGGWIVMERTSVLLQILRSSTDQET